MAELNVDAGDSCHASESEVKRRAKLEDISNSVPATALQFSFCQFISRHLDADDDLRCQDWRGFAEKVGLKFQDIHRLRNKENKVLEILDNFQKQNERSIGDLITFIRELERFDILGDPCFWDLLGINIQNHQQAEQRRIQKRVSPVQDSHVSSTTELTQFTEPTRQSRHPRPPDPRGYQLSQNTDHNVDQFSHIVTGDVVSHGATFFDAFVAYTNTDIKFVKKMLRELETAQFGLSLCVNARDLLPGTPFYTVTAKLIEERCKRIIIVLSPDFMYDPICDFYVKFAHSLSPGSRSKKLIPVLTSHCFIPQILRYITLVDYTKSDLQEWFWERLARSLQAPLIFSELEKFAEEDLSGIQLTLPEESKSSRYVHIAPPRSSSQQQHSSPSPPSVQSSGYSSSSSSSSHQPSSLESRGHQPSSNNEMQVDGACSQSQYCGPSSTMATVAIVHSPSPSNLPFANSSSTCGAASTESASASEPMGEFVRPPEMFCDPPPPPYAIARKGSEKSNCSRSSDMTMSTEEMNNSSESVNSSGDHAASSKKASRPVATLPPKKKKVPTATLR